jgi:DoxX-like family
MNTHITLPTRPVTAALVVVWLGTALASAWTADTIGPALLAEQPRLPPSWHPWLIWGGAGVDLALGLAMWLRPGRLVWGAALAATLGMTAIASWIDPTLWWHPLGPLTKNLPIIALLWALRRASS